MDSNIIKEINDYNISDSEDNIEQNEKKDFNISYILIKIDDNLSKKKYSKIVKEITKIEKDNKEALSKNENVKYFVYLFEIKILCLCRLIEGKMSEYYIYKKNNIFFNSSLENSKSLEKNFDKLKKILEEDMTKFKTYMYDKSLITDSMKEHIILSYARGIYLQGKYCKLKRQITDAASFFNIGLNLLHKHLNKSIEGETFLLYGKFLLSLSSILIEDKSYIIASEKIFFAINLFIKSLYLTIDNPNGINIDDPKMNNKKSPYITSIKGLIICLFLLGICLEKVDLLDNAVTLYGQSYWLFKKFYKNIDPIFFSIIENISYRINGFKEDMIREIKRKYIEEKKREKMRIIEEKNIIKAMKLTNISNRGTFNAERYLKMEKKIKNVLVNIEKKYGNKNQEGKIYLPIIKYLNMKNNFNFTFNHLVKEKEKLMEKIIESKNNKKNKTINTENNITYYQNKIANDLSKNNSINNKNNNNKTIGFYSFDNKNKKKIKIIKNNKKRSLYKIKLQHKLLGDKNYKIVNEDIKLDHENFDNKQDSNICSNIKPKSNSINKNIFSLYSFSSKNLQNHKNFNLKSFKSGPEQKSYDLGDKLVINKFHFSPRVKNTYMNNYTIDSDVKQRNKQKEFITKNSFVFCKSFKKGMQYLEKMDKREMQFQKQLLQLKNLEDDFNEEIDTINNYQNGFNKDKIKEDAEYIYLAIKDKIDEKIKNENNIELNNINDKSKEIEKIMLQKIKLENNLIMGLNNTKIEELKKLEESLKEMKDNQFVNVVNNDDDYKSVRKKITYSEDKLITDINNADIINHEMIDSLDNEIIKYDEKRMNFKNKKRKFYVPRGLKNLKFFKFKG